MVAETHTSFEGLRREDIVDFIVNTLAKIDVDPAAATAVTLTDCGFSSMLEIDELAELSSQDILACGSGHPHCMSGGTAAAFSATFAHMLGVLIQQNLLVYTNHTWVASVWKHFCPLARRKAKQNEANGDSDKLLGGSWVGSGGETNGRCRLGVDERRGPFA